MCSLSAAGDWRSSPFAAAMSSLSFGSRMSVKRSRCQQRQPSERRLLQTGVGESRRDRSRKRQGQALAFWSGRDRW